MRPERRTWGPSIDIGDAEVVADVFRGLQDVVGISVFVSTMGAEFEVTSLGVSVLGWRQLADWLASVDDFGPVVDGLATEGYISGDQRTEAVELLCRLRDQRGAWEPFTDPDEPNLLELVADT